MSSLMPAECIGFHRQWLKGGHSKETTDDLDTREVIKALVGLHYENHPEDILSLIRRLNQRTHNPHRLQQIQLATDLIQKGTLTIVDAMFLLFSREELVA